MSPTPSNRSYDIQTPIKPTIIKGDSELMVLGDILRDIAQSDSS